MTLYRSVIKKNKTRHCQHCQSAMNLQKITQIGLKCVFFLSDDMHTLVLAALLFNIKMIRGCEQNERSEGAHSQLLCPSASGVRSLGLEVVPKLSSLLFGHGQVGGPHGGGVLEHTAETHSSGAADTHLCMSGYYNKKSENVTGRD